MPFAKPSPPPISLLLACFIGSCGGAPPGGDGDADAGGPDAAPDVSTGQLSEFTVSGLRYETASQSGETDSSGKFSFVEGEEIEFFIGQVSLGSVAATSVVTLLDISGQALPTSQNVFEVISHVQSNLSTLVNLAVLLQSLDDDGDATNGVVILPSVAALMLGSMDFEMRPMQFRIGLLNRVVTQAQPLFSIAHPISSPSYALNSLYAEMGISLDVFQPQKVLLDVDGVGGFDRRQEFFYGGSGRIIRTESEESAPLGMADSVRSVRYDQWEKMTSEELDSDNNGAADRISTYEYDAAGNLLRIQINTDGLGEIDRIDTRQFDENGNETLFALDTDNDGGYERVTRTTYNADNQKTGQSIDSDGDGMNDESETLSYGANGSWFFVEKDNDANGTIDLTIKYFFDANGNLVREERNQNPSDTKQIDYLYTAVYDSEGRRVDALYDNQGDGLQDEQVVQLYDGDKLISRIVYFDESPVPSRQTLFEYDDNDLPIKISVDNDDDPEMEFIRHQSFDTSGNLIRRETDAGADGVITKIETHTYDNFGNQTRTELANEVDVSAQIDFISTREYVPLGWGVLQESNF